MRFQRLFSFAAASLALSALVGSCTIDDAPEVGLSLPEDAGLGGFGPHSNLGGSGGRGGSTGTADAAEPEESVARDDLFEVSALDASTVPAPGLLANDTLIGDAALVTESLDTRLGGSVELAADGSFVYTPPSDPGALPRLDNFAYRLVTESGEVSATVSLGLVAPPLASDDEFGTLPNQTLVLSAPGVLENDQANGARVSAFDEVSSEGGVVSLTLLGGLTYAPPSDFAGEDSFTYTLSNITGTATATVYITVDEAPSAAEDHYIGSKGQLFSATPSLLANDALGAPQASIVSFGGGSLGGTVADHAAGTTASVAGSQVSVGADGTLTLTPDSALVGPFELFYLLESSAGSAQGRVVIDVHEAPLATDDAFDVLAGEVLDVTASAEDALLANDVGTPAPIITHFGGGSLGGTVADHAAGSTVTFAGGQLLVRPNGSFGFAAAPDASGEYTFDYQLQSAAGQDEGTVRISVDHAPEITSPERLTLQAGTDQNLPFELTTRGFPEPVISIDGVLPDGVVFEDGSLTGSAGIDSAGEYDITVTASNGVEPAAEQTLTITVQTDALITGSPTATFTVGTAGSYEPVLVGLPTPVLTLDGEALPDGLAFDDGTGAISGTPAAGTGGVYELAISADNGLGAESILLLTLEVLEAPGLTSAASATFVVGEQGSFSFSTTGHPARTVSVSGTLPSGVAYNTGNARLAGTPAPGSGGSYELDVSATNGVAPDAGQSFTLTVNEAPSLDGAPTTTFRVGQADSYTLTSSGFPAPTLGLSGGLPSGVSFDAQTGTLSGTPGAGTSGTYPLTFSANNGIGTAASLSVTLNVDEGSAITSANATTFTVGTSGSFTVTATGTPAPTLSLQAGALPAGVTFTPGTGVLAGTPDPGTGGTYSLTFSASNGVGSDGIQSFTLTILQAPALIGASTTTFTVGSAGSYVAAATGFPAPTLSLTGTLPDGVSFQPLTGTLSGTPVAGTGGSYPLSIGASNGVGIDASLSLTLTVEESAEITSGEEITFLVGEADSFTVTATGTPTPTLALDETLPAGLTFTPGTGVLEGTPAAGTGGEYTLTFSADNGVGSLAVQTATLTIEEAPGLSGAPSATFVVGSAGSYNAARTGFPLPTLSLTGTLPAGLTFNTATGSISGTPQAGTAGSYAVSIGASNGIGSAASLPVTIQVDEAPGITSGNSATFTVGTADSFTVTATGTPAPTFGVTGTLPTGVTLNTTSGVLSGTPASSTGGTYPLTLSASNGVGSAASQAFTLTVNEAPGISGAATTTFVVGSANSYTPSATGFPAPSFSLTGSLPGGLSFSTSTGAISGTAASGTGGSYPLTITASNGIGSSADLSVTLEVTEASAITSANSATFTVGTADSFTVTATGTPAPTFGVTGTLPTGVTLNTTSGVLSGTPAGGTGGTYPLTLSASNGVGSAASQAFTLTVNQAPGISGNPAETFFVGTPGSFTPGATGFPAPSFSLTGSLPDGLSFSTSTGAVSGTAASGTGGSYPLTITASNGIGSSADLSVTLNVLQAPAFTSVNATTFTVGSAGSFTVTASGTPSPTFGVSGTLPAGVTLNTSSGVLSGTPAGGAGGVYPLTLSASNVAGSATPQGFTLIVNEAPSISGAPPSPVDADTAYSHTFTFSGFPSPTFSVTAGTLPTGITLNPSTGALSGTPTVAGTFSNITVQALNSAGSADITFTITVDNAVPPPSATGESFTVTGNIPIDVTSSVLSNDTLNTATITGFGPSLVSAATTTPGDTLTTDAGGSVVLEADGTFVYDPPAGTTGADSFAYTITNAGGSATAQVNFVIGNRVWFVDSAAAGGGSGKLTSPFTDLTEVTSTTSGDVIYALRSVTPYSAKTLSSGQRLLGQGVTIDATHLGFSLAPFSRSTAFGTAGANSALRRLVLATNSYVRGFDVSALSGIEGLTGSSVTGVDIAGMAVTASNASAVNFNVVSGTVSLRSVTATGGTSPISLSSTTGSFTVTGDGSGLQNGSGGTIQSSSAAGVSLQTAQNVTLRSMNLQNITTQAVLGTNVVNLTLQGMQVSTIGTALDFDENVAGNSNISGTVSITNSSFSNATAKFLAVLNFSGTLTSFTFENNSLTTNPSGAFEMLIFDAARAESVSIKNNTFTNAASTVSSAAIQVYVGRTTDANSTPFARVDVESNTITGSNGSGIRLRVQDSNGTLHTKVLNNSVTGMTSSGFSQGIRIEGGTSTGNSTVCAEISGNTSVFTMGGLDPNSTPNAGIGMRRQTGSGGTNDTFGIVGLPAGSAVCPVTGTSTCAATPAIETFITGLNPGSPGAAANGSRGGYLVSSTTGFSSCTLP